ncbi:MAG: fused MFS/spermidine synthase [Nitrospinae bacterium]|nr:fused MFS/spermidine synthase [Nitrospinota bacterium]
MEVSWIRAFTPVLGTKIYAFAMSLATYLLATLVGSQLYRMNVKRKKVLSTPTLIGLCFVFGFLPILLGDPRISPTWSTLLASIFPICLGLGYLTPKLIDQFSQGDPGEAGRSYAINILGGILGPVFAAYLLIPGFGVKWTLILLAAPYGILFLFSLESGKPSVPVKWIIGATGSAGALVAMFYSATFENPRFYGEKTLVLRDHTATVIAYGDGTRKRLLVNGVSMTILSPIVKMMVHLPLSVREKKPESGLIIAFGMGTSLRSMASWGIETKCVDLIPGVPKAMSYFHKDAEAVKSAPNVEVIIDDGRRYLKRTSKKFDVIIIDPPPPVESAGTSLLYSIEFNQIVADHLNEGGIFQAWFPSGEFKIFKGMLTSLVQVFPHVKVYESMAGWGLHLLASKEPFETPTPDQMVSRLPERAKKDLMEWAKDKDIREYVNLTLKKEIPIHTFLNDGDPSIYISDDRPFNEYFLLRRLRDNNIGKAGLVEELFLRSSPDKAKMKGN